MILIKNPENTHATHNINLNINRARISSTKCCVPFCHRQKPDEFHRIPRAIRYEIMKTKRFFIPENARACYLHRELSVWPELIIPNENCAFTTAQIEEMVDLLRSDPKPIEDTVQGKY